MRNKSKWTISASNELKPSKGVDCEISHKLKEERNIPYNGLE